MGEQSPGAARTQEGPPSLLCSTEERNWPGTVSSGNRQSRICIPCGFRAHLVCCRIRRRTTSTITHLVGHGEVNGLTSGWSILMAKGASSSISSRK